MLMPDLARAAVALTQAATVLATFKAGPQSIEGYVAEYDNLLTAEIRKAFRHDVTAGEMSAAHRQMLKNLAPGCYYEGMRQGGVEQDEADETDAETIKNWISDQIGYTSDFAKTAVKAGKDKAAQQAVLARADMWLSAMLALGNLGRASAQANTTGTWKLGKTEQHCDTCYQLNGKRHRLKWYISKDYIPRKPGAAMTCGGWRCDCSIVDNKGNQLL